jgi:hypothetical protein
MPRRNAITHKTERVESLARPGRGDICLVLMVGRQQFDLLVGELLFHVGDRQLDRLDAAGAVETDQRVDAAAAP